MQITRDNHWWSNETNACNRSNDRSKIRMTAVFWTAKNERILRKMHDNNTGQVIVHFWTINRPGSTIWVTETKDGTEAGPREGIRKGNLRVSKSRHNTRTKNENRTYKGQKDGPPDGLIGGRNEFGRTGQAYTKLNARMPLIERQQARMPLTERQQAHTQQAHTKLNARMTGRDALLAVKTHYRHVCNKDKFKVLLVIDFHCCFRFNVCLFCLILLVLLILVVATSSRMRFLS